MDLKENASKTPGTSGSREGSYWIGCGRVGAQGSGRGLGGERIAVVASALRLAESTVRSDRHSILSPRLLVLDGGYGV